MPGPSGEERQVMDNEVVAYTRVSTLEQTKGVSIEAQLDRLRSYAKFQGWTIKDEANHIFTFPQFALDQNGTVTIHTGSGINTNDSLFWSNQGAIWNNDGDTLYLRNKDGELILSYAY